MIWIDPKRGEQAAEQIIRDLVAKDQGAPYRRHRAAAFLTELIRLESFPSSDDAIAIVNTTLHKDRPQTVREFEKALLKRVNEVTSLTPRLFKFVAMIAADRNAALRPKSVAGVRFSFPLALPASLSRRRDAFGTRVVESRGSYRPCVAVVRARSSTEAFERALAAFDLLLALWSYVLSQSSRWRISLGGSPAPLGPVPTARLKSIHGSHFLDDAYLIGPMLDRAPPLMAFRRDSSEIQSLTKSLLAMLSRQSDREELKNGLRLYVKGLNSPQMSDAFMHLWTAFEHLAGQGYEDSDQRVARASNLFENREQNQTHLKVLRGIRNRIAHAGYEPVDAEVYAFEAKFYVEQLLRFHFALPTHVRTHSDALVVLDHLYAPGYHQTKAARKLALIKVAEKLRNPTTQQKQRTVNVRAQRNT